MLFLVNFRGFAIFIAILVCLGAAPKTTALALLIYWSFRLYLWAVHVNDRWSNWQYRRRNNLL